MSTAQRTQQYINEHPHIKHCLQQNIINYASLARHIAQDLDLTNKTSIEAIMMAARRFQETLPTGKPDKVHTLLQEAHIHIQNKITIITTHKHHVPESCLSAIQGSQHTTILATHEQAQIITNNLQQDILHVDKNNALILLRCKEEIEQTPGVVSHITSLLAENNINIKEFFSCHTDTIILVEPRDITKAIEILEF